MTSPQILSPETGKKPWYRRRPQGRFLVISIIVHVLLILLATYLVVQTFTPRKKNFTAPPKAASNKSLEHKIEVVKKQKAMSAPMQMNRIVTKGMSKVVLPEMPVITTTEPTELTSMSGMGGPGTAFSAGGGGSGGGGAGGLQLFGLSEKGNGLTGTLYDLKQTASGSEAKVDYVATLRAFCRGGWSTSMLRKFYSAPDQLNAARIWIPKIKAEGAPKAFNAEKYIQPKRWVIHYKGKVRPPSDGKYRFVGQADDILVVRFNRRDVLDGSLPGFRPISRFVPNPRDQPTDGPEGSERIGNDRLWVVGDWIDLKASQTYDMEILLGEFPGGHFNAYLAFEKEGETYEKSSNGATLRPVFRLRNIGMPNGGPPYMKNGPVWTSIASDPAASIKP